MAEKAKFATKIGLVAATVGSAIGLGNVWRFPGETQANGGAAFLIIYLICVLVLGIPVMLAEFSLGRAGQSDSVGNFKALTPNKKWWIAGVIGLLASYLILSYYMVVAGWTMDYLWGSLTGGLYDGYDQAQKGSAFFSGKMDEVITSVGTPIFWTIMTLAINLVVLLLGVRKGIEKISNVLMPMLFVLLLIFCFKALSLPNSLEGLEFFLKPDFSKITIDVALNALGQAFFSLSLGMGILVTYSAYFPQETHLARTAMQVSMLDFVVAFMMGLIIFPALCSFNMSGGDNVEGTTLVFVTMPEIFANMYATSLWSVLFFLLLAIAAITSTISLGEVAVAFISDRFGVSRRWACIIVIAPLFVLSPICSLSLGAVPGFSLAGMPIFNFLDTFATNLLLPLCAFLICIYVGWVLPKGFIDKELTNDGDFETKTLPVLKFLIRYISPVLILLVFAAKIIDMLGN
ncbi:MAG: sodium-dependent transporter [Muribaculaceae bacterium]